MVLIMSLNHLTWRSTLKPNSCSGSHCFRFSDVSMKWNLCRNQVCLTNVFFFFNFLAVFVVAVSKLQRKSVAAKVCCSQLNWKFCYVSNEPAALPSPPLFFQCLACGVTGELALPLACHLPRPSMESRGGERRGCWSTFCLQQVSAMWYTNDTMTTLLVIWQRSN